MSEIVYDRDGDPIIDGLAGDILALERRLEYLEEKVAHRRGGRAALDFDAREAKAIRSARAVMLRHKERVESKRRHA